VTPLLPRPEFGAPLPPVASPETLALLAARRSASAQQLAGPAPDDTELETLLRIASRVPDHGKLCPWRFIVLRGEAKTRFADAVRPLAGRQADPDKARAALRKLEAPPLAVAVISRPQTGNIPAWEQELSAGAVCMLMLLAAQSMGYGANWITDWYSYDAEAASRLGLASGERVAGFIYVGTPTEPPLERVRPEVADLTSVWEG
jgi:nitroreductase